MNITTDDKHCHNECPKQCKQVYSKLNVKASIDNFDGDSYLKFDNDKAKQFSYQAEGDLSLIQFIADIGGLFGLYLGITFIEIGTLINHSIKFIKKILKRCIIFKIFQVRLMKLNFFLTQIESINFTIITKLIFPPILIYQLITMFDLYFQYSTQTNYALESYNMSDNKYSVNEFPAITVCNEQLFDKIWFEEYYNKEIVDFKKKIVAFDVEDEELADINRICKVPRSFMKYYYEKYKK